MSATWKRRIGGSAGLLVVLAIVARLTLGFFVVQPIGAVPDGATIVYWRVGLALPFVESADGVSLRATGSVNLLGRGLILAQMVEQLDDRRIMNLPYSRTLYLLSTDGQEFDR